MSRIGQGHNSAAYGQERGIGHNSQGRQTVYRRHGNRAHTAILNSFLQDSRISHETKGLVAEMLSYPEDWDFTVQYLTKNGKSGRDKVYRMLKEAEKFGYIIPFKYRALDGKIQKQTYLVSDDPDALIKAVAEEIIELEIKEKRAERKVQLPPPVPGVTYVYAAVRGKLVKVGKTQYPEKRITHINATSGSKAPAEIVFTISLGDWEADFVERGAHLKLSNSHHEGEWFKCSPEEAIAAIKTVASLQLTEKPYVAESVGEQGVLPSTEKPDTATPDTGSATQTKNIYNKTDSSLRSESADGDDQLSAEDLVWGNGLRWLVKAAGISESKARPIIGRWLKVLTHDELLHAMRSAKSAKTGDPVAYIGAIASQATQTIGDVRRENGRIVVAGDFKAELTKILNGRDLQRALDQLAGKIPIGLSGVELQTKVRSLAIEMMDRIADQDRRYLQAATAKSAPPGQSSKSLLDDGDRPKNKPRPREEVEA